MVTHSSGAPHELTSTMAALSAGIIGLVNLILTCRPFTRLRVAVCTVMCAAYVGAVACFHDVFFLQTRLFSGSDWLTLAAITAAGIALLIGGTRLSRRLEASAKKP